MSEILEKIKKIEALIDGARSEGERRAALLARERLFRKKDNEEIEYHISTPDLWRKKLFMALCRKYGLSPYRFYRQKYTTVMVKVNKHFLDTVLWKEYLEFSDRMKLLIDDIAEEIISKIHQDEEEVVIAGDLEFSTKSR